MERSAWIPTARAAVCAGVVLFTAACSEERAPQEQASSTQPREERNRPGERPRTVLDGSHWLLVEIRLANGETVRPEDPETYRFHFRPDGVLAMRLNCNLASTGWLAAGGKRRGTLAAGAPVATHAPCRPPSLDQTIVHDVERLASYALRGERLHLALKGGGSFVFKPAAPPD